MPYVDGSEVIHRAVWVHHYDENLVLIRLDESKVPAKLRKAVRNSLVRQANNFQEKYGKAAVITIHEVGLDEETVCG